MYCNTYIRRWIYNWTHGLTGLFLGQIAACKLIIFQSQQAIY